MALPATFKRAPRRLMVKPRKLPSQGRSFFPWYNGEHRHGGIAMLTLTTPTMVEPAVLAQRQRTLRSA